MAERNDRERTGDEYDRDLERDNQRGHERHTMSDLADELAGGGAGDADQGGIIGGRTGAPTDQEEFTQHARKGQAESPAEQNHYEPPKHKEGHDGHHRRH